MLTASAELAGDRAVIARAEALRPVVAAASEEIVQFIGDTIEAVMTEALDRGIELTPTLIRKISCTCYKNSIRNGTEPKKEVATVFEFLSEIV